MSWSIRMERHQHWHRTPALVGSHAGLSRHGLSAVPGYESVGRVVFAGPRRTDGRASGSSCRARAAMARCAAVGGAALARVAPGSRMVPVDEKFGEQSVLMALAATAYHAIAGTASPACRIDRRARRPRASAGAHRGAGGGQSAGGLGDQPRARGRAPRATGTRCWRRTTTRAGTIAPSAT